MEIKETTEYCPKPYYLLQGTVLGERYEIGTVIGEGNFGITYIGWDSLLESRVAIKEFFPISRVSRNVEKNGEEVYVFETKVYEENLHKYLDEGKRLSRLNQVEGIVSIRDFVHANNTAYIIMDYIEGISLKEYVKNHGPIALEPALDMMRPVMQALEKVHANDLIHRDISPDNIMVTEEGKLVLVDFGSARQLDIMDEKSRTVQIKDGFSSPELYISHGDQGPWSDVYSICATLYYMLVGMPPEGAVSRLLKDEMPPLTEMPQVVGEYGVKAAIMKGMNLQQDERYPTMGELGKALRKAKKLKGKPVSLWKWCAGAGACMLAVVLAVGYTTGLFTEDQKMELVPSKKRTVERAVSTDILATEEPAIATINPVDDELERPQTVIVPQVKGFGYKKAKKLIQNAGMKCKVIWVKSEKKSGQVIKQSKEAGLVCQAGSEIQIRVSKGVSKTSSSVSTRTEPSRKTSDKQYDGVIE